jgi:hypothetical protein
MPQSSVNLPFSSFPSDYGLLPTVSFVVPNLDNDMHDGSVAQGDAWLHTNLWGYAQWAATHNSLLIVTFDECDTTAPVTTTTIFAAFYGAWVKHTVSSVPVNHYSLLRLLTTSTTCPTSERIAEPNGFMASGIDGARAPGGAVRSIELLAHQPQRFHDSLHGFR